MLGVLAYATIQLKTTRNSVVRETSFQIAEAGVNYYQWHLAHFPNDFWDGNASSTPGPYVHDYIDADTNQTVGRYSLTITPPLVGSTIVTISSTGYTLASPKTTRTVTVRYGIPSLAQYAFLTNSSQVWIGNTENVTGQFYSNGGIHFDGTGNALISSAKTTYTCTTQYGCGSTQTKPGIWGSASASTQNFWQFPRPNIDFSSITSNLATMKTSAQSGGLYLTSSSALGYSLEFKSNATIDVYKVTSLKSSGSGGQDIDGLIHSAGIDYNGRTFQFNRVMPANGIIYIEDNTWVEGTVKGRATIAAAKLPLPTDPTKIPNIMIPNNILYAAKDGTNTLGLIAQQDILITYLSPNVLEVDAALIAQTGSAQRYYWNGNIKNSITIYGTIASFGSWTWSWVNGSGNPVSGYTNTSTVYDSSLLYSPPPSFPLTSNGYQQISWNSN